MTKVGCILVVDVANLSLLAQWCCCCAPEPSLRRQLLGRLLSAFLNAQIEQLHHCMLFSLQHLQFVMQWSSSLHTEHSHTSRADQDKCTQISKTSKKTSPQKYVTLLSVQWNETIYTMKNVLPKDHTNNSERSLCRISTEPNRRWMNITLDKIAIPIAQYPIINGRIHDFWSHRSNRSCVYSK